MGFNIFCRNLTLNLVLVIQLTVAILLINTVLGQYNSHHATLRLFKNIAEEKGVYYMPSRGWEDFDYGSLKNVKSVSEMSQAWLYKENRPGITINAIAFDYYVSSKIKFNLEKGKWFTEAEVEEGVIPVVVSSEKYGFEIGQTVPLLMGYADDVVSLTFKVVGVMSAPLYTLNYSIGGNMISFHDLFSLHNEERFLTPLLVFDRAALPPHSDMYETKGYKLIFFDNTISKKDFEDNLSNLSTHAFVQPIDVMYNIGKQEVKTTIRSFLPFIIASLSISVIGLISINILNTFLQLKVFAIYFLCGSRWRNCLFIMLYYMLNIVYLSLLLLGAMYFYFKQSGVLFYSGIHLTQINIIATLGVYAMVLVISLMTPFLILKNAYPIEIIRQG